MQTLKQCAYVFSVIICACLTVSMLDAADAEKHFFRYHVALFSLVSLFACIGIIARGKLRFIPILFYVFHLYVLGSFLHDYGTMIRQDILLLVVAVMLTEVICIVFTLPKGVSESRSLWCIANCLFWVIAVSTAAYNAMLFLVTKVELMSIAYFVLTLVSIAFSSWLSRIEGWRVVIQLVLLFALGLPYLMMVFMIPVGPLLTTRLWQALVSLGLAGCIAGVDYMFSRQQLAIDV